LQRGLFSCSGLLLASHRELGWLEQLLHGAFLHNLLNHLYKSQDLTEAVGPKRDSGHRRLKEYYLYFRQACQSHLADYASPGYGLNQPACSAPQAGKYSEDTTIAKEASAAVGIAGTKYE
jgi:hypothetical protein